MLRYALGDAFDKQAAFSAFDRISHTKRRIQNMTGATDEKAAELTSIVLVKANEIQERFGGNLDTIIATMVDKIGLIQDQVNDNRIVKSGIPILNMKQISQAELREYVESRLLNELDLHGKGLYQAARNLLNLAYALTIEMRREKAEIAAAILDVLGTLKVTDSHRDYLNVIDPPDAFKAMVRSRLEGMA